MHDASTPRIARLASIALLLTALTGCGKSPATHSHAEEHEAAEKSLAQAVEITSTMLKVYRDADSYTDHATYVEESVLRGEGVPHEIPYYEIALAFHRPNQLRLEFSEALADAEGQRQGFHVACDGEFLRATLSDIPDQIVEKPAPAALTAENVLADPLVQERLLAPRLGDVFPHLAMLLNTSDEDSAAIFPDDESPRMLADETLEGRDCYRIATSHPEGMRVLWIDRETYVLRRMELPVEGHRQRIDPDGHFLRLAVRIDFIDPVFDAEIVPKTFTLDPPKGARRVRRFVLPEEDSTTKAQSHQEEEEEKDQDEEGSDGEDRDPAE